MPRHTFPAPFPTPFPAPFPASFPAPFRHAFAAPLLGPLRNPFDQRHRRFLQGLAQIHFSRVRADPGDHLPHPRRERATEIRVRLRPQPAPQRFGHPRHVGRRPALLETDHRPHQVAERKIVHRDAALVKQQRALRRLAWRQRRRHRRYEIAHLQRARPRRVAVVEHHRQHRRPLSGRAQLAPAAQLPVKQRRVFQVAQRHAGIVARLELEQHQQVQPAVAEPHPPGGVATALLAAVADVLGGKPLERVQVDVGEPVRMADGTQQVAHHAWEAEQAPIDRIVHDAKR